MKFGLSTLTSGVFTTREAYMAVARAAERAGFDFLSVSDHVVVPARLETQYPYRVGGAFTATEQGYCFDQLATIAFLAGCTERLRLLTSVMVVPHRPAMLTAKMLSTIDVLSNGRLIFGAGAGWMKEEFALLDAPFEERGRVTDEFLAAFRELWTKDQPAYSGKHVSFSDVLLAETLMRRVLGSQIDVLRAAATFGHDPLDDLVRIGHVAQEAPGGDTSLIDWVLAADTERASLLADPGASTARIPER